MDTITVEQRLRRFLKKVEKRLNDPKKNEAVCCMLLYHIAHISEALTEGDENIAAVISSWMEDNNEKFRFCATEDDFHKMINQIKRETDQVMDQAMGTKTFTERGNKIDFNKHEHEHFHDLLELIPDKKGI